jgi:hypothetical protein
MNDDDLFHRLNRIDPLGDAPAESPHSARAMALMERITSNEPLDLPHASVARTPLRSRPTRRWFATAGIGAAAAVAAIAVAVAGPGATGNNTVLAWTPTPRVASVADGDAARAACVIPSNDVATDDPTRLPENAVVPSYPPLPATLAALDLRGNGGLAVFADDSGAAMCLVQLVDGAMQYAGMVQFGADELPTGQGLAVESGMTTGVGSGSAVSMLTGQAASADRVELMVPGLEPITATLSNGRFAAWWPESASSDVTTLTGQIVIRSYGADGTLLEEISWAGGGDGKEPPATDPARTTAP